MASWKGDETIYYLEIMKGKSQAENITSFDALRSWTERHNY